MSGRLAGIPQSFPHVHKLAPLYLCRRSYPLPPVVSVVLIFEVGEVLVEPYAAEITAVALSPSLMPYVARLAITSVVCDEGGERRTYSAHTTRGNRHSEYLRPVRSSTQCSLDRCHLEPMRSLCSAQSVLSHSDVTRSTDVAIRVRSHVHPITEPADLCKLNTIPSSDFGGEHVTVM